MNVLFDATGVQTGSGGMTTFLGGLLEGWSQVTTDDAVFLFGMPELPSLPTYAGDLVKDIRRGKRSGQLARIRAQQLELPRLVRDLRPDVLLAADPSIPLRGVRCPVVAVVHDLRHLERPAEFSRTRRKYREFVWGHGIRRADRLIVNSEATSIAVKTHYPSAAARVRQVRFGADHVKSWAAPGPVVGRHAITFGHWSNKRPDFSIRIWGALYRAHPTLDTSLEIVGVSETERPGLLEVARAEGVEEQVNVHQFVPDAEYRALFASSSVVLMTSTLEGFGLPVVEAMQLGIPVVVSQGVGMETAGGSAALYADPNSVESFRDQLASVLTNEDERARVIARGREHARTFNWADTAASARAILNEAIEASRTASS